MAIYLYVKVHAANTHDKKAGCKVLDETLNKYPNIKRIIADNGYRGTCVNYIPNKYNKTIEISKKIKDQFAIQPIRWCVERTFSWALMDIKELQRFLKIQSLSSRKNFIMIAHSVLLMKRIS
jgi:transposase